MRIAVTGARGFIGSHVLDELARRDVEVVATERGFASRAQGTEESVQWIPFDIAEEHDNPFETLQRPDVLLHLAWDGLPNYGSLHHFETELPRQYRFLNSMVGNGLRALVTVGTCFEYGAQSGPLSANLETRPTNPYGFAKDVLRKELEYLQRAHPFKLTWARLFYIYGERQSETSLLSMLKKAVAAGDLEFPMSGGEQLRDYLSVSEVARRLVDHCMDQCELGPVNLCAGRPTSVRRLVEQWIDENGWKIVPKYGGLPYSPHEPMAFWGDTASSVVE